MPFKAADRADEIRHANLVLVLHDKFFKNS